MNSNNMTMLISAFARAYHNALPEPHVFCDPVARKLFSDEEYRQISETMAGGIAFFCPTFSGTREEALRWIADHQLSPSPVGRAAFAEQALACAVRFGGAKQVLILAAGLDTFAYRQPEWASRLAVLEIDLPTVLKEKQERLARGEIAVPENVYFVGADFTDAKWTDTLQKCPGFTPNTPTFCSMLGLSYYLSEADLRRMLQAMQTLLPKGSTVVFDYPAPESKTGFDQRQRGLAAAAGAAIAAGYSETQMEQLLADCGFLLYEHLAPESITARFFAAYQSAHPEHPVAAPESVCYALAVRQ